MLLTYHFSVLVSLLELSLTSQMKSPVTLPDLPLTSSTAFESLQTKKIYI